MQTRIKVFLIILGIILVISIIGLILWNSGVFGKKSNNGKRSGNDKKPDNDKRPDNDKKPDDRDDHKNDPNAGKNGIYFRSPSSGYKDGIDFMTATNYCSKYGGAVAQIQNLHLAHQKGMPGNCQKGWYRILTAPGVGWFMRKKEEGCGKVGFNKVDQFKMTDKYGVFCQGIIPKNGENVIFSYSVE